jgi:tetratricopeptide (TPR) repeat protein/transcriptional regulator with XRE-family HTH domain
VAEPELSFAGLLQQLRAEAKLTQEELAEATGLSSRSISDLERGISRTAHKDTGMALADALGLPGPVRELFVSAARGRAPAADVLAAREEVVPGGFAAATRSLPRDIATFTGRQAELAQLMGALAAAAADGVVRIHAINGMAGTGKTTFAVHAAHRLAGHFPDGQFFLPLHAHTPGHRPVDPANALASLLLTAGSTAAQIPPGLDARAGRWRDHVAGKKILLLLDDAASHEQVRPLLPGTAGSLVLITSRRRLTALQDAAVISLGTFSPAEAATLLVRLAARPGLRVRDAAVGEITQLCGYLPLAIGMLASQLRHHPAWTAAKLAADLSAASDRLALMHAENLSVAAAFGLSYAELTPGPQQLFRRLGLLPGPSIDAYAAAALDGTSLDLVRRHLDELYDQHLITEPAPGRYQLHDLLREHAHGLAAGGDPAASGTATGRLLDYYLHTAAAAGQHFAPWGHPGPRRRPSHWHRPADTPDLSTPERAAAWLEAERPNLHAAADQAAARAMPEHATAIAGAMSGFLLGHGHWDQAVALHQTALSAACRAGDQAGQADALTESGILRSLTGDYPAATASLGQALALYCDLADRIGQACALTYLGFLSSLTGDYPAAIASQQRALTLYCALGDRLGQARALNQLGVVQQLTGDYPASAASQQRALSLCRDASYQDGQAWIFSDLGVVQKLTGDYPAAAASQQQALALFRDHGDLLGQAWALNSLGVVQQLTGDYPAAAGNHQHALDLFRDIGHRHGQADALNELGDLSSRTGRDNAACDYYTQALALARDIGTPLEEAHALEGIGHIHLHHGNLHEGSANLRQALTIYRRIGALEGRRVQEALRQHGLTSSTARPGSTTSPTQGPSRKRGTPPAPDAGHGT